MNLALEHQSREGMRIGPEIENSGDR